MTVIEPVRADLQHPERIKKYSAPLRCWHWANAVIMSGSLITVLINSTLTGRRNISAVVQQELKTGTGEIAQQGKGISHALSDQVWGVHTWFGYALAALLLFRLLLESFQLTDQKFVRTLKAAYTQFRVAKKNRELARHEPAVKSLYAVFYLLLIISVVTGLLLAFEDLLGPFKSIRHSVEVHGFCMYLLIAFIVVHLAGVLLAERKDGAGIVSDMINGGREK